MHFLRPYRITKSVILFCILFCILKCKLAQRTQLLLAYQLISYVSNRLILLLTFLLLAFITVLHSTCLHWLVQYLLSKTCIIISRSRSFIFELRAIRVSNSCRILTCCILDTSSFMSYTVQNCLPLLIECISVIAFPSLFPSLFPFLLQLLQQPFFIFSFMSSFVLLALWFPSLLISCTWPFLFTHPYYSSFLHE